MLKPNMENVTPNQVEHLGALIDELTELKVQKAAAEAAVKELESRLRYTEGEIIRLMADAKLEKAANGGTTVTPKRATYPQFVPNEFDMFAEYVYEHKYIHLLQKRVAVLAYRELLDLGRTVPGVVPYVKTELHVSKSLR